MRRPRRDGSTFLELMAGGRGEHLTLGQRGEALAQKYLISRGYEVLGQNVKLGRVEIDLIVRRQQTVVFVEVKTRSSDAFGAPEESVTARKQKQVVRGIVHWLKNNRNFSNVRFDVVAITLPPAQQPHLKHFVAVGEAAPLALLP